MINYPLRFASQSQSSAGVMTGWVSQAGDFASTVSIPAEFEGPGGGLSPEDLFNQALANCFIATFKVYAERSRLSFENVSVQTELVVGPDDLQKPVMREFYLRAQIQSPSNSDKALLLARKAAESGFILNSVKTQCHFEFVIQ